MGEGTGLGLATVDGIVKQSGGSIEFAPETSGATFRIYLPRAAAELSAAAPPATESTLPPGGERVLVVEDDPAVGGLVNEALLGLGYSVT